MRLAASGRADLLRELRDGRLTSDTAALYCFSQVLKKPLGATQTGDKESHANADLPEAKLPQPPATEFPSERPQLAFLRAVRAEPLAPLPPPPADDPVREEDLAVPWGRPGVSLVPLTRWSRLAGWLRQRLGREVPGTVVDLRRLLRGVARGEPVLGLPRHRRPVWASQALVFWDETREMRPFQSDIRWLMRGLERERGRNGLTTIRLHGLPQLRDLARLPADCPVIALSAMGQFTGDSLVQAAWEAVGRRLHWLGHPMQALSPCPHRQWSRHLAAVWPMATWDRGARFPRLSGSRPVPISVSNPLPAVEELLDLLAPARRVSPELLRAARLCQPSPSDAGVEWLAWFHVAGWNSLDCFGYRPGPDQADRLMRRAAAVGPFAAAAVQVGRLIQQDHETHSPALAGETTLRLALASPGDFAPPEEFGRFLARVVDRLRQLAAVTSHRSANRRIDDLPRWIHQLTDALTPEMRSHASIREPLAQCLALADTLEQRAQSEVAPGINLEAYSTEARAIPTRSAAWVGAWELSLAGGRQGEAARIVLQPQTDTSASGRVYLAPLPVGPGPLLVEGPDLAAQRFQIELGHESCELPLPAPQVVRVSSRLQRLHCEPFTRPAWARRLWQDRFGLAAEFAVGGVPFVLRWIPPGRFLMGSPEDEPGRWTEDNREGPQHEVTISRGFWLGETPVTQGQWRAVVEATQRDQPRSRLLTETRAPLNPSPSYFRGPPELPVEQVTWDDCRNFCEQFSDLLRDGPRFNLPTEAQWEYACRAGTATALYTGPLKILGEHNGPELDPIAWYGGNSGRELEVMKPFDSSGWPEKQYQDSSAGTHRVKLKRPNAWGLYDTLGNVWEWCADEWGDYSTEPQFDPFRDGTEDALRVVRGGSWSLRARDCRAAVRDGWLPGSRNLLQGFRLAAGLELQAAEPQGRRGGAGAEGRSPKGPFTAKRSR